MKKKVLFAAAFMLATVSAFAKGNGIAGITEATNIVTSYFDPGTKLIYAVGAVVGLIGGVKVYSKFSSGEEGLDLAWTNRTRVTFACSLVNSLRNNDIFFLNNLYFLNYRDILLINKILYGKM